MIGAGVDAYAAKYHTNLASSVPSAIECSGQNHIQVREDAGAKGFIHQVGIKEVKRKKMTREDVTVKCGLCGYVCYSGEDMAKHYVAKHYDEWKIFEKKQIQPFAYADIENWN